MPENDDMPKNASKFGTSTKKDVLKMPVLPVPDQGALIQELKAELSMIDERSVKLYEAMNDKQKAFCMYYLVEGDAGRAYQRATNSDSRKVRLGSAVMSQPEVKAFLDSLLNRSVEAQHLVVKTYFDMIEATTDKWIQNRDTGKWENVGSSPDWRARKEGAEGLRKVYGLDESQEDDKAHDKLPSTFVNQFNVYLESRGMEPVEEVEAEDAEFEEPGEPEDRSKYANFAKQKR